MTVPLPVMERHTSSPKPDTHAKQRTRTQVLPITMLLCCKHNATPDRPSLHGPETPTTFFSVPLEYSVVQPDMSSKKPFDANFGKWLEGNKKQLEANQKDGGLGAIKNRKGGDSTFSSAAPSSAPSPASALPTDDEGGLDGTTLIGDAGNESKKSTPATAKKGTTKKTTGSKKKAVAPQAVFSSSDDGGDDEDEPELPETKPSKVVKLSTKKTPVAATNDETERPASKSKTKKQPAPTTDDESEKSKTKKPKTTKTTPTKAVDDGIPSHAPGTEDWIRQQGFDVTAENGEQAKKYLKMVESLQNAMYDDDVAEGADAVEHGVFREMNASLVAGTIKLRTVARMAEEAIKAGEKKAAKEAQEKAVEKGQEQPKEAPTAPEGTNVNDAAREEEGAQPGELAVGPQVSRPKVPGLDVQQQVLEDLQKRADQPPADGATGKQFALPNSEIQDILRNLKQYGPELGQPAAQEEQPSAQVEQPTVPGQQPDSPPSVGEPPSKEEAGEGQPFVQPKTTNTREETEADDLPVIADNEQTDGVAAGMTDEDQHDLFGSDIEDEITEAVDGTQAVPQGLSYAPSMATHSVLHYEDGTPDLGYLPSTGAHSAPFYEGSTQDTAMTQPALQHEDLRPVPAVGLDYVPSAAAHSGPVDGEDMGQSIMAHSTPLEQVRKRKASSVHEGSDEPLRKRSR